MFGRTVSAEGNTVNIFRPGVTRHKRRIMSPSMTTLDHRILTVNRECRKIHGGATGSLGDIRAMGAAVGAATVLLGVSNIMGRPKTVEFSS